jgi:uncharacterized protein YxeA
MGILKWAISVVTILLFAVIIGGSIWFVQEHDRRAEYYKKQLQICRRASYE